MCRQSSLCIAVQSDLLAETMQSHLNKGMVHRRPCCAWAHHPLSTLMCSSTWKLPKPCSLEVFVEDSWHLHYWLNHCHWWLTQSSAPLLSPEVGGGAESYKFLIKAWFFWWIASPAPAPRPETRHCRVILLETQTLLSPLTLRKLQRI